MIKDEYQIFGKFGKPDQPIYFIDGVLKMLHLMMTYNRNIFIQLFETELTSGIELVLKRCVSFLTGIVSRVSPF